MVQTHLLSVLIFLPLVGSLAILLLGRDDHEWVRRLALATSLAEFLISLFLLRGFDSALRDTNSRIASLDQLAADSLSPGNRRDQPVSGAALNVSDAVCGSVLVE